MIYNNVLIVTLSNIGDCLLTLPTIDILRHNFSGCRISVLVGPRGECIFKDNPLIANTIIFDKHSRLSKKIDLAFSLRRNNYDLVIDFRNTFFPFFINALAKTTPFLTVPSKLIHMKDRHLYKTLTILKLIDKDYTIKKRSFYISDDDNKCIDDLAKGLGIKFESNVIVISPGARSYLKRWQGDGFVELIGRIVDELRSSVVLVGDEYDQDVANFIAMKFKSGVFNLCGKTTISQMGALLKKSKLLISNDSAVMHIGSYLDVPTLAIFGPTDEAKYGPWGRSGYSIRKNLSCTPCQKATCRFNTQECMNSLEALEVFNKVKEIVNN